MNLVNLFLKCNTVKRKWVICRKLSTIYSLSSGYGKCGVSIIRVSGPQTTQALKAIVGKNYEPKQRYAYLKYLYNPETKDIIDRGLVLWFPGPFSFTGEDSCEFHVHGSIAVISALLNALSVIPGLRPATSGEFTKRAFFGGKLDLTEVEGLADLIHAETEVQRKQALLQSRGFLSRIYDGWRKRLIKSAAHLEAFIDFAEDENISSEVVRNLTDELHTIILEIREHLNDRRQGELVRNGVQTVIIGPPNVGKSSFLNLMCQRKISIVTPLPGTTRDIIQTTNNFGGYPVVFSDTAGLRKDTNDIIEQEGIALAKQCLQGADLILLILDASDLLKNNIFSDSELKQYMENYFIEMELNFSDFHEKRIMYIANKIDLLNDMDRMKLQQVTDILPISCKKELNMNRFFNAFESVLKEMCGTFTNESPRITNARHRQQLELCMKKINLFLKEFRPDDDPDMAIAAQKLRRAIHCIERITGHISADDILDVIFKDFCIGK